MGNRKKDQLRILGQRFKSLGMSRRNFMKIAAAAAAGTVTTAGMERYVGPGAGRRPASGAAAAGRRAGRGVLSLLPTQRIRFIRLEPQPLLRRRSSDRRRSPHL